MRERITTGSVATLGSVSLLGESAVDITPSTQRHADSGVGLRAAGTRRGQLCRHHRSGAARASTTHQAASTDIRAGRGTVGKLMTDEQLYAELNRFVATAGDVTRGHPAGRGTLGKLLNDPTTANALEASLKNIETLTRAVNAGEGSSASC